jgi:hypothetical protein
MNGEQQVKGWLQYFADIESSAKETASLRHNSNPGII